MNRVLFALLLAAIPTCAVAADPVGVVWPADRRAPLDEIDHAAFTKLLAKYVDDDGFVDYRGWKASAADRAALLNYLKTLGRGDPSKPTTKDAKLAFWINAYNALTIEGILREYPTTSIRNHTARFFGYNIWEDLPLRVGAGEYSLDTIEHKILRKLGEPRIHFAIVCASVGCPTLRDEAYTAAKVDEQLAENARDFFARPKHLTYDPATKTATVSSILDWFGEDFGDSDAAILARVKPYLPADVRAAATAPGVTLAFRDYDWSLNDQARKQASE